MEIKYFTALQDNFNFYELKQNFKKLSLKYHPDKGGETSVFQSILTEYEFLTENIGIKLNLDKALFKSEAVIDFDTFLAHIDPELIIMYNKLKEVVVDYSLEICGDWFWVTTSKENNNVFNKKKGLGFSWSPDKKKWYFKTYKFKKYTGKSKSMAEIRDSYNSYTPAKIHKITA